MFEKGKSGNPRGRPKSGYAISEIIRKELDVVVAINDKNKKITAASAIVKTAIKMAIEGDINAATFLFNRGYGMPTQDVEINTPTKITIVEQYY